MIGNKLEQSIISIFQNNLSSTFSINQIAKILKKSYPNINKKSNYLLKEGVLGKIVIGKSYQCYLNLANEKARILAMMNEINKRDALIQGDHKLENFLSELYDIGKKFKVVTILIYKDNIIFVSEDISIKQKITLKSSFAKEYGTIFFDRQAFQQYIITEENFQKNHLVAVNTENFMDIVSEISEKLLFRSLLSKDSNNGDSSALNSAKDGKNASR